MTYRGFISRSEAGLRPPRSRSLSVDASRGGVTGHHAGGAQHVSLDLSGHDRCLALWRGYQRHHMDARGFVDIAYSMGCCQHGFLFAGRGANVRTAANGTNAGNYAWYALQWIGGGDEIPSDDAVDAFWVGVRMLRDDGGAADATNEHKDHKPTTCAGNLGPVIDAGPTTKPKPPKPPKPETNWTEDLVDTLPLLRIRKNLSRASDDERRLQGLLAAAGLLEIDQNVRRGRFDGKFGPSTLTAVRHFQSRAGLRVDGLVGRRTWTALLGG